jgi:hypothetical protein
MVKIASAIGHWLRLRWDELTADRPEPESEFHQQRIGIKRRDFPRSNASDNASIGRALMPKSSKPNNIA